MRHKTMIVPFLDLRLDALALKDELEEAYRRVMDSGRYILGEEVEAFEAEWGAYCGARHCIGVGNGLEALHLILRGYGIGAGDEVIVPGNTYIATWLAASYAGARPIPVEPVERTYNLDPEKMEAAITKHTRAVIAVHLYGQAAEMAPIRQIAERHGLKVIEDAAQAHGAIYTTQENRKPGGGGRVELLPEQKPGRIRRRGGDHDERRRACRAAAEAAKLWGEQ